MGHQTALFVWAQQSKILELKWMFAIPNGGQRNAIIGSQLKASGTKAGVPDIFLPIPRNGFKGLWIELKRPKKGIVSAEQHEWLEYLGSQGYANHVCFGWEEARDCLLQYLNPIKPVWKGEKPTVLINKEWMR